MAADEEVQQAGVGLYFKLDKQARFAPPTTNPHGKRKSSISRSRIYLDRHHENVVSVHLFDQFVPGGKHT
jgi:hypothetical protein